MTTMTIADSTYQRLEELAKARKLSIDAYLAEMVSNAESQRQLAALESFAAGMARWAMANQPPNYELGDDRETICEGRGG